LPRSIWISLLMFAISGVFAMTAARFSMSSASRLLEAEPAADA
jgi:hypothetical protein